MKFFLKIKNFLSELKSNLLNNKFYQNNLGRISSYPYISGDTFLSLADAFIIRNRDNNFSYNIYNNNLLFFKRTNKKDIIFLELSGNNFNKKWVFDIAREFKKVIFHNGDKPCNKKFIQELVNNKIYVFGTNINFINKYVEPIPIGIENAHIQINGDISYYNPIHLAKINYEKSNILLSSFRKETNPMVRERYDLILKSFNFKNKIFRNLKSYRRCLANSFFVICPPGNGIDCHRVWEAFIHKTIPIIERKFYLFEHIDLPVLILDDIGEFFEYSDEKKIRLYNEIISRPYEQIYIQWWIDRIMNK